VLGNPVTEFGGVLWPEDQVESAEHRRGAIDEQVERTDACLLLGDQFVVLFGEVLEVRVATVGDRSGEERSIGQLEHQHRGCVVGSKKLQLRHCCVFLRVDVV
jgi:hypothetical protein